MRTLHACAFVAVTALAVACGGDDPKIVIPDASIDAPPPIDAPPDAREFDFSCMGNTAPTTAPATLAIVGSANDINILAMSLEPVVDATVTAFRDAAVDVELDSTQSDAGGAWNLSIANPTTTPLDGYVSAVKTGHRSVRLYPPSPINADIPQAPLLVFATATFDQLVSFTGNTQAPGNGTVGLAVIDCSNTPIEGATISVKQGGIEQGMQQDLSALQPGLFLVFDVPPGDTVVSATFNGMILREHTVEVVAATTSTTAVKPGF